MNRPALPLRITALSENFQQAKAAVLMSETLFQPTSSTSKLISQANQGQPSINPAMRIR